MEVGLSLGSNLGDRLANLREARRRLEQIPLLRLLAAAPLYETEPVGVRPEHAHRRFLNTVLIVEYGGDLDRLSEAVHAVEADLGRRREADRNAPRLIDIDLLYAADETRQDTRLTLPHPRWAQRRFVVRPLADVRPDLVLPGVEGTVREVLEALPEGEAVTLWRQGW